MGMHNAWLEGSDCLVYSEQEGSNDGLVLRFGFCSSMIFSRLKLRSFFQVQRDKGRQGQRGRGGRTYGRGRG